MHYVIGAYNASRKILKKVNSFTIAEFTGVRHTCKVIRLIEFTRKSSF